MFSKSLFSAAVIVSLSLQVSAHAGVAPLLGVNGTPTRNDVAKGSGCGKVNVASTIDTSTPVQAAADGTFTATAINFDKGKDGSRQVTLNVDPTGVGKNFVAGTVTQNGDLAPTNIGTQQIVAQLPAGTQCTGGKAGNLCLASFTTAGGFSNCVVVQQGASNATSAANTGASSAAATDSSATAATDSSAAAATDSSAAAATDSSAAAATDSSAAAATDSSAAAATDSSAAAATDSSAAAAATDSAAAASASASAGSAGKKGKKGKKGGKKGKKGGKKGKKGAKAAAAASEAAAAAATATVDSAAAASATVDTAAADASATAASADASGAVTKRAAGTRAARALRAIEDRDEEGVVKRGIFSWIWA